MFKNVRVQPHYTQNGLVVYRGNPDIPMGKARFSVELLGSSLDIWLFDLVYKPPISEIRGKGLTLAQDGGEGYNEGR